MGDPKNRSSESSVPQLSTDDDRSATPLKHLQTISFDQPLPLEVEPDRGLTSVRCAYETWGELNEQRSNAILVCHAISGDSHAARHTEDDDPGWWDALIGPGKPIDTNRFYVVCPNVLGGCRGSTGPSDIDPASDPPRRYGADFPRITIGDIIKVQRLLADALGIDKWRAVVGGSLGGQQALQWSVTYPDRLQSCVVIASAPRLTSQALGFDVIARNAIQTDPHFADGQYYEQLDRPDTGLAIARMLGHVTYLSSQAMEEKFESDRHDPRQVASAFEQAFSVGSYLAYQGQKFTTRFDANSYVTLSMAMDLFDLGATRLQLMETFDAVQCDYLLISFSSDWLFPPSQSQEIVNALTSLGKSVTYTEMTTGAGHDAFLIENDIRQYQGLVEAQLGLIDSEVPQLSIVQQTILEVIPDEASVLDLGCGDGQLMAALADRGHDQLMGVDVASDSLIQAAKRGLDVIDFDLNTGLQSFIDHQFDVVVMTSTLQSVVNVVELFNEMLRVGKRVIISFPNFAFRTLRKEFAENGRSPKAAGQYDYEWYNTPNRRFASIADVHELCSSQGIRIEQEIYFDSEFDKQVDANNDPNLNADTAILVLVR